MGEPRRTVGGVLILNHKILLGKRMPDRLYPDIWDIFGGHIEEGEALEETLVRELEEELGIEVVESEFLEQYRDKDPTYGHDYIHNIFIVQKWEGEPYNKNPGEHESLGWFSKEECRHLKMHGEVKRIILEKAEF